MPSKGEEPASPLEAAADKVNASADTYEPVVDRAVDVPAPTASSDLAPPAPTAETPSTADVQVTPTRGAASPAVSIPAPSSASTPAHPSPAPRRPKPPTKGILKPPPPPAKPTLTNRLRDIVTVVGGGAKSLFDPQELETAGAGPSTPQPTVGGTLNALSGRLTLGLSRFVSPPTSVHGGSPTASPAARSVSLPETGSGSGNSGMMSEKSRQKQPLKRATFLLPSLSITYPISSAGEPWSQKVIDDRKRIESTHRDLLLSTTGAEYWTSQRLVGLYESACRGREERARVGIVRALEVLPGPPRPRAIHIVLRTLDDSTTPATSSQHTIDSPLNRHAAEALADVLTTEWGLVDLKLENGVLDGDDALKPILHALLISGSLPTLSLAGNKKIKAPGWRLLAVFLKRATSLRFVDLSDTVWDKKGIDSLVQALNCTRIRATPTTNGHDPPSSEAATAGEDAEEDTAMGKSLSDSAAMSYGSFVPPAPLLKTAEDEAKPAAVQSLRMDGCGLKANMLETFAQGIRSSNLRHISLRRNRIGPLGAVALAIMMRDYPDSALGGTSLSPQLSSLSSTSSSTQPTFDRSPSPLPYAARRRPTAKSEDEAPLPPIPLVISSAAGGVTSRTVPLGYKPPAPPKHPLVMPSGGNSAMQEVPSASFAVNATLAEGKLSHVELGGASMALQRSVRALDGVERIGRLLTLDLKSNEIRNGVSYIAQVLKRNRTLKVLNLADNRIDGAGLALLAEALKYNSTLETLDLSNNPCCGPLSEGIAALRTTFTVNTSLKRLFLADTGLTTDGAISLAEFLPESKSLLHLDLTANPAIETAGILAISVGLRANSLIRCLDISIPPNSPDLAEISQNILQACIRNTELAASSLGEGKTESLWVPIKRSVLVKSVKRAEEARAQKERVDLATSPEGQAREFVYRLKPDQIQGVIGKTVADLDKWYTAGKIAEASPGHVWEPGQLPSDEFAPLLQRARVLRERLGEVIQDTSDAGELEKLLRTNDELSAVIDRAKGFTPPPRLLLPSQIVPTPSASEPAAPAVNTGVAGASAAVGIGGAARFLSRRHMRGHSLEISSPNFSIGNSDGDSDAEELDEGDVGALQSGTDVEGLGLGDDLGASNGATRDEARAGGRVSEIHDEVDVEDSPVEKVSKAWVEEEGEIFRKGTVLGVGEDDEEDEDRSGEQLKQEILDTPVARTHTRRRMSVDETDEGGGSAHTLQAEGEGETDADGAEGTVAEARGSG